MRAAASASYGVTGLADDGLPARLLVGAGIRPAAVRVRLGDGIRVELRILVAAGVPIAEIARQVDSVVRYSVRQAVDREIEQLTIYVGGMRLEPARMPDPDAVAAVPGAGASATAGPGADAPATAIVDPADARPGSDLA